MCVCDSEKKNQNYGWGGNLEKRRKIVFHDFDFCVLEKNSGGGGLGEEQGVLEKKRGSGGLIFISLFLLVYL